MSQITLNVCNTLIIPILLCNRLVYAENWWYCPNTHILQCIINIHIVQFNFLYGPNEKNPLFTSFSATLSKHFHLKFLPY